MRKEFLILLFFTSCYTEIKKPDDDFMKQVKQQANLDAGLKTLIKLNPRKLYFVKKKNSGPLAGFFYIKNTGKRRFNLLSLKSNCGCLSLNYHSKEIQPNDSLKVVYVMNVGNKTGLISNSIVAIGNCQFGNQTFYIAGTSIDK